jgi:hypothetical protein
MRTLFTLLLVVSGSAPAADAPLQPLEFLVGHCWQGAFPDGKSQDKHCFEPVFDGKFIRDRHVVTGERPPYSGETIYWLDHNAHQINYLYFASDGGVSTGIVEVKDGALTFPNEKYTGSDGKSQTLRTVWEHKGENEYVAVTEQEKAGKWIEAWRIDFKRVSGTGASSGVKPGT